MADATVSQGRKNQATRWPVRGPARVLLLLDRPVLVQLVKLTLNHGVYATHAVEHAADVEPAIAQWHPHMIVLDMDLDGHGLLPRLTANSGGGARLPIIGLTRRGDLRSKLAAFEAGVDDILTIPFAPEELPGSDGMGLDGMRERVALLEGRLDVESAPGGGTTLVVEVPVS